METKSFFLDGLEDEEMFLTKLDGLPEIAEFIVSMVLRGIPAEIMYLLH